MIKREIQKSIKEVNETFRILALTGPRQVGKSMVLESMLPSNMKKISLDDRTLRDEARENPKLFLETYGKPLFIDEVQFAPELFPYIKMETDRDKTRGQYWLSGSQTFELIKNLSESLAGRVGIIKMNSLTYREIHGNTNNSLFDPENIKPSDPIKVNDLFECIFRGGMPELYDYPEMKKDRFFSSYIDTYIEKDVSNLINIKDKKAFINFLKNLAIRNGGTLNYSDIAKDVGVSSTTIKEWVNVLISSRIIYLLEPYSNKKIERLTKMPKIIFMDSGFCSYLAGFTSAMELQTSSKAGLILETYVISEIIKSYEAAGIPLNIMHLRKDDNNEIDLIINKNLTLYPLEIKRTANPKKEMLKNFKHLENADVKIGKGGLICLYDTLLPIDDKTFFIPISSVINVKEK